MMYIKLPTIITHNKFPTDAISLLPFPSESLFVRIKKTGHCNGALWKPCYKGNRRNWAKCLRPININQTAVSVELLVDLERIKCNLYTAVGFCAERPAWNSVVKTGLLIVPRLAMLWLCDYSSPLLKYMRCPHFNTSLLPTSWAASCPPPSGILYAASFLCFRSTESVETPGFRELTRTHSTRQSFQPSMFSLERNRLHCRVLALTLQWLSLAR